MKSGGIRINYDSYNIEIEIPSQFSKETIRTIPFIRNLTGTWVRYHSGKCLNKDYLFGLIKMFLIETEFT